MIRRRIFLRCRLLCSVGALLLAGSCVASAEPVSLASTSDVADVQVDQASVASRSGAPEPLLLKAGLSLELQIQAWARHAGWTVTWRTPDDWIVPGDHAFSSDFAEATQSALTAISRNGADIRVDVYPDDHSVVVSQAGTE